MQNLGILILGKIWPEAHASAASTRVLDVTRALVAGGARVTFATAASPTPAMTALAAMGVSCVRLAPNDAAFDRYVGELHPNIAFLDTFTTEEKFGWRLKAVVPDCLRILDTIDLHFLRLTRERLIHDGAEALPDDARLVASAGDVALREVAAIYRSDLALITSDRELRILTEHCGVPAELLHLCRLSYPPPAAATPFGARRGYAAIGSFRHPPNVDGLAWLRTAIWPKIRARQPDAEISVWGSYARPEHLAWSSGEDGFRVLGPVADHFAALRSRRLNLAPLRFGAGIKGKIADGWWCGTPAVTTAVGAEGMTGDLPFGGAVADDPEGFAEAALRLYDDEHAWSQAAAAGQSIIDRLYSPAATTDLLLKRVERCLAPGGRSHAGNFTSRMIWQQGLRATEYFSRWIETKETLRIGSGHRTS